MSALCPISRWLEEKQKGPVTWTGPSHLRCIVGNSIARIVGLEIVHEKTRILADLALDLGRDLRIILQEALGVLSTLPKPLAVIGEPSTRLLDHTSFHTKVDELAHL